MRIGLSSLIILTSILPFGCTGAANTNISLALFTELEQLARLVDVAYCVGTPAPGVQEPFECPSRCSDFEDIELIQTFSTGPFFSDSCGYLALANPPTNNPPRVILAFRGTYSLASAIADIQTLPQEYIPYDPSAVESDSKCENCTVHAGFYNSWIATRDAILEPLTNALAAHPGYRLEVIGHSLGGAVAILAGLDLKARGWNPVITAFGAPMIGNNRLAAYVDHIFGVDESSDKDANEQAKKQSFSSLDDDRPLVEKWRLRRLTHVGDIVPKLPPQEMGYAPSRGELFIDADGPLLEPNTPLATQKMDERIGDDGGQSDPLADAASKIRVCEGSEDPSCIWGAEDKFWVWNQIAAHRAYIWKLGLCAPSGWGNLVAQLGRNW